MVTHTRSRLSPVTFGRLLIFILIGTWMPGGWAAGPDPLNADKQYNISPQPLSSALLEYSQTANVKIFYDANITRGISSHGLSGRYSSTAALRKLLEKTGIVYSTTPSGSIKLLAPGKGGAGGALIPVKQDTSNQQSDSRGLGSDITLPKVSVEADSAYDPEYYADPYNKDYVIPNATAGTKTDTPIMETPLNVQVVSKQVLKDQQVIRLADALKNVSGVTTTTNSGSGGVFGGTRQSIFLRGFESQTHMRNGFRLQEGSTSRELANVEAVEVLKGPAAILYGLVEPGGMVNVVTKQPLATPYYGFTQQFGSYELYRSTFDASGPLTKNKDLLYRANLSYENSGSFRDFVGREDVFFAPVLRWNISPKTQITFEMEYNHLHQGLDAQFIPVLPGFKMPISRNYGGYNPSTTDTIFGGFNWSHQFDDDWFLKHRFSVNQRSFKSPFAPQPAAAGTKEELQKIFGATDENPIADPILNAQPDGSYVARGLYTTTNNQNNTTSTNLDLVGHFDTASLKHTLLLGGDYYGLDTTNREGQPLVFPGTFSFIPLNSPAGSGTPFSPSIPFGSQTNHTDQFGLYIQDQIKLPYDVQVMGGIRYQYIHQSQSTRTSVAFGGNGSTTNSSTPAQDAVTPRVGILWHPKSWFSLYANYAESFGVNEGKTFVSRGVGKIIEPTSAEQYEGGVKFEFFDGKLRTNLTYYDLTKTNVAVADPNRIHDCGGGLGSCSVALGEVRSRGPEIDIQGEILPGWNVIATWANTDIRIGGNEPIVVGFSTYKPGSRLVNVPRNTGSLWSNYEVQAGDFKGLSFGGGVNLRDGMIVPDITGTPGKIPGYATVDLMAGYSRQVGDTKFSIQFNVNNLLDKQYFSSRFDFKEGQASYVDFGTPRTFMGQVSVQY